MNTHRGFASILVALVAGLGIAACGGESAVEPDQAQADEADDTVSAELQTSDPQEGGEVVRDHRSAGPEVRDHRGEGGEVRDHRGEGGAQGGVVVGEPRDHRYEGHHGWYDGHRGHYGHGGRAPYWRGPGWRRSHRMERYCRGIGWNRAVCEFERERRVCIPFVGCFERIF